MSAQALIEVLKKQLKLHGSLLQLAQEKTGILKKGELDALNEAMKNEQKHIAAIQLLENKRGQIVAGMFPGKQNASLQDCMPHLSPEEREEAEHIQHQLAGLLFELKYLNELNQSLIDQSMQYVFMNLDLLMPSDTSNYQKEIDDEDAGPSISLFDSKA
ncbi:flagellar protein FlgN [Bacillus infantis]|uniref:flagellar protein FlgN n=1 Tax=Bacillus infantis TaxID=324767 RepID=UPI0020050B91|nr:flagellar protein FlgN [Bacillus infantis]MCK6206023.1 flagellar protein FlgN [Bacillus infantis]